MRGRRFVGLELLRFVCAVSVLIWHYQHFFMVSPGVLPVEFRASSQPLYPALRLFYLYGDHGVPVFWQISGFIFVWKYAEVIHQRGRTAWEFFVLRFSRLYPLHLATLVIVAALQGPYIWKNGEPFVYPWNDLYHFTLNIVFASQWGWQKGFSFNGPVWSVSVEVLAYALFFAVARTVRLGFSSCVAVFGLLCAARLALPDTEISECLVHFFAGGTAYWIERRLGGLGAKYAVLFVLVAAAGSAVGASQGHWGVSNIASSMALVVSFARMERLFVKTQLKSFVQHLGDMTYASYLIHFPLQLVLVLMTDALQLGRAFYMHGMVFAAFVLGTLLISSLIYRRFEFPTQERIRHALLRSDGKAGLGP